MRRLAVAVVLLFLAGAMRAQTLGPVDWIFLVDTSKSMRGVGGTKDIWGDVKVALDSFVRQAGGSDTVVLYLFDREVRQAHAPTRDDLYHAIQTLEAEGNRTHLGAAISVGLERAAALRTGADPDRTRVMVLFTDGREDVRGIPDPIPIMDGVNRVGDTFIYFVSMGEHELQLDAFAAATERTTMMKVPSTEAIRNVAREIRKKIPVKEAVTPRPPPPPPPPSGKQSFPLVAVLIAIALIALATLIAFLLLRRKQNRLEGELEILRPRAAPDAAFVGLPSLQASEVVLSSILPADALAGSDARLFVRRKAGRKKVWIAAQSGSLRINDVETPASELYDADTIEIGGAKLRFNRVGDERPYESNQEEAL